MKIKLRKLIFNKENLEGEIQQFCRYKTIKFKDKYLKFYNDRCKRIEKIKMNLKKIDGLIEDFTINSFKIMSSLNEEADELILIGEIKIIIVAEYKFSNDKRFIIKNISIPFTTKINIPKDICKLSTINLEYDITDLSIVKLCDNKALVSITSLIKYRDLFISD